MYWLVAGDGQQATTSVNDAAGNPLPDLAAKVADAHATLQASHLTLSSNMQYSNLQLERANHIDWSYRCRWILECMLAVATASLHIHRVANTFPALAPLHVGCKLQRMHPQIGQTVMHIAHLILPACTPHSDEKTSKFEWASAYFISPWALRATCPSAQRQNPH